MLRSDRVRAVLAADHRGRGHRDRQRQNLRQNGRKELWLQMIKIFLIFQCQSFSFNYLFSPSTFQLQTMFLNVKAFDKELLPVAEDDHTM